MKKVSISDRHRNAFMRRFRQIVARGEYVQLSTLKVVRNRRRGSMTVGSRSANRRNVISRER